MNKTILQVPITRDLKDNAEKAALSQGFSSLQEVVRVFLFQLVDKKVEVKIQEPIYLSEKAEKRYLNMEEDYKKGKKWTTTNDPEDFFKKLDEN